MTRAILLCAGFGTRLGPLSDDRPKPALPVCGIAIVRYGIALLAGHGVRDVVINLHHAGDAIRRAVGDGTGLGVRVHYVHETEILGTGGGIKNALPLLDPDGADQPILSLNGKLIFDLDVGALLDAFARAPDALGMMVVRRVPDALEWGAVDVDRSVAQGDPFPRVRDILGAGEYMFAGVHVTRPSVVRRLPDGEACMVRQGYLPWLSGGETVAAFVADREAYFAEHSTPERYLASNLALIDGASLRHPPGVLTGIDPAAEVDPSAEIRPPVRIAAGARVAAGAVVGPGVVVDTGATVLPGAHITRAVLWPGARADGQLADCVVTPRGPVDAQSWPG